ncbi:MAG: hypothetical protein ACYC3I_18285 [Gemmataceae bacterium]
MPRFSPLWGAEIGLFAALLTCGCQQSRCCCSGGSAASTTPVVHTSAKIAADAPSRSRSDSSSRTASSQDEVTLVSGQYGHDPEYHWLEGLLVYSWIEKAWWVRYLPFEEDDRYGGCVTLVGGIAAKRFKPGQIVRVEGHLIDPSSRQLRPAFQVESIRAKGS